MTGSGSPKMCLLPTCVKVVNCRGLCKVHYSYAGKLIRDGEATWAELEESGKVLAPKTGRGQRMRPVRDWFLREAEAAK